MKGKAHCPNNKYKGEHFRSQTSLFSLDIKFFLAFRAEGKNQLRAVALNMHQTHIPDKNLEDYVDVEMGVPVQGCRAAGTGSSASVTPAHGFSTAVYKFIMLGDRGVCAGSPALLLVPSTLRP